MQKKCFGCHVLSSAVTHFCSERNKKKSGEVKSPYGNKTMDSVCGLGDAAVVCGGVVFRCSIVYPDSCGVVFGLVRHRWYSSFDFFHSSSIFFASSSSHYYLLFLSLIYPGTRSFSFNILNFSTAGYACPLSTSTHPKSATSPLCYLFATSISRGPLYSSLRSFPLSY